MMLIEDIVWKYWLINSIPLEKFTVTVVQREFGEQVCCEIHPRITGRSWIVLYTVHLQIFSALTTELYDLFYI
jgi:hypothetical protein